MNSNSNKGALFLAAMTADSVRRVRTARRRQSEASLRRQAQQLAPARALGLEQQGFDLIAEVKFVSPGNGSLSSGASDPEEALRRAQQYASAGAAVVSVLTQPSAFRGSLEHLKRVASGCPIPVMRKDFLVHSYQAWEARAAGADGVLIVLRILDDARVSELLDACAEAGLFALVEAFDADDLERAKQLLAGRPTEQFMVGVNNRDLGDLGIDFGQCLRLSSRLPANRPAVAESGLETPEQARSAAAAGYRLALVGSTLMRCPDPGSTLARMLRAGRGALGALR